MSREEALRELVEKWRKQAENIKKQSLDREPGYFQWLECNREHANELEAILAQPEAAQPEKLAVTAPITHEQCVRLADYIFQQKPEEQRQTLIDCLDLVDWEKLVALAAAKGGGG